MEHPGGIPVLRDPRTRRLWAQVVVRFPGWEGLGELIGPEYGIQVIRSMLEGEPDAVILCTKLLEVIALKNVTWEAFLNALIGVGLPQLANAFHNEVQLYNTLQNINPNVGPACLFLLFTPRVNAASFVQRMTQLTYRVSGQRTVSTEGQAILTFTRLLSTNALSPVSIVIAQMHTTDYTDLQYIKQTIGVIPNLVIVHKEIATPEIDGNTQFCVINSSIQNMPLEALNYVCNHEWCQSPVRCKLSSSLSHTFQLKFLCDYVKNFAVDRAGIQLHDDAAEIHLPCLINRLVVSPAQIMRHNNWSFIRMKFNNEEHLLTQHFIFFRNLPHIKFMNGNVCEVIAQLSIDRAWELIFRPEVTAEELLPLLNLDIAQVKALSIGQLHDLLQVVPPHLHQYLAEVEHFLMEATDQELLPLPLAIMDVTQPEYHELEQLVLEPEPEPEPALELELELEQLELEPAPEPEPALEFDLPYPAPLVWVAKGSDVWAQHLHNGDVQDFLETLRVPRFFVSQNEFRFPRRTVAWFAVQSVDPVALYKANNNTRIQLHNILQVDPQLVIFSVSGFSHGQYLLVIGTFLYLIFVPKVWPKQLH
jgi:hypothetical protein